MLRPGTSLRTTETVVGCTPRCSATSFKLTRCCRVVMLPIYYWKTSYRFLGLAVNRFVEQHGLFRTPAIGVLQATLLQAGKKWKQVFCPQSQLLRKLSLLCLSEVKVGQIHIAFEDDVKC